MGGGMTDDQIEQAIVDIRRRLQDFDLEPHPDRDSLNPGFGYEDNLRVPHRSHSVANDPGTGNNGVDGDDGGEGLSGSARSVYPAIYDLYNVDVTAKTVKIRGYVDDSGAAYNAGPSPDIIATKKLFQVAGVHTAVSNGSASFDTAMTVAGAGELFYLYIETTLSGPTTTITLERSSTASGNAVWNHGGDFDPGVKARIYQPLWWVEVAAGIISRALDLRFQYRSDRAGN